MHLNISSAKWRPFCLGLNDLMAAMWLTAVRRVTYNDIVTLPDCRVAAGFMTSLSANWNQ